MKNILSVPLFLSLVLLVSTNTLDASSHLDPMSVLNGRHHKHRTKRHKRKRAVRWVASKRSLASYGRMKHEYLGSTHNNQVTTSCTDLDIYSKHVPTDKPYLEFKSIDGPLPQDYAKLAIKSKTLLSPTKTHLKIVVDKSIQRIFVYRDLEHLYTFKSSTGKAGHRTPSGVFRPYSLEAMHYSRKYYNSPMPWSVFFNGGVAIHGTEAIHNLGRAASHGCVRTHPKSARRIYNLVRRYGRRNTTIIVRN